MYPWTDRTGRFSLLKSAVFASLFLPGLWLIWRWRSGDLGPLPIDEAILESGQWTVRLILLALALTPLQQIFGWNRLVLVRRQVGLAAMSYALLHFSLFMADQKFDLARVASEIALRDISHHRLHCTDRTGNIGGHLGGCGGAPARAQMEDAASRRLWDRRAGNSPLLHAIEDRCERSGVDDGTVYPVDGLSGAKTRPAQIGLDARCDRNVGRAGDRRRWKQCGTGSATGIKPMAVLQANLLFPTVIRPAWYVLGTGLAVALLSIAMRLRPAAKRGRQRPSAPVGEAAA